MVISFVFEQFVSVGSVIHYGFEQLVSVGSVISQLVCSEININ